MSKMTARTILTIAAIGLLLPAAANSQIRSSGDPADLRPDATDPSARYRHSRMGRSLEEWARHLHDDDVDKRLEAVALLESARDPKAVSYLIDATNDAEPRVAIAAVDALGKLAAKEASEDLADKLFLAGKSAALRQHVLVALGRIRDPSSAPRIIDFAEGGPDTDLRAVAIRVLADFADDSTLDRVNRAKDHETDPSLKTLWQDAAARISARRR